MEKFILLIFPLIFIMGYQSSKVIYKYENEIVVEDDKWISNTFPLEEFKFYELNFESFSPVKNYWAIIFFDQDGNQLIADNYSSFEKSDRFVKNKFYFRAKYKAKYGRVIFQTIEKGKGPFKIRDIIIKTATEKNIMDYIKKMSKEIPPVKKFYIEKEYLKKTMEKLKKGEKIRIVLLGDSIMNDIGNSFFDILLKGLYPEAKIEIITSVRGGTGCWYYEKENRVKEYVLDYKPDLLIIGGISNKDDTESIRSVIRQVKEKQNPEIIIMSKAVGKEGDPRINPQWTYEIVEGTYRDRMKKLAEQEKLEFFDIEKYWGEYIKDSNLPYEFFLRDPIHANEYGKLVLAYLLFYYFSL